jgi:ligand-binding SRPBCC domain-containing protein
MTTIELTTQIAAPPAACFDAARSIDLHLSAAANTDERVVKGRTSGLCELGEEITWQARHFGVLQKLSVRITAMEFHSYFVDEMVRGAFKSMRHEHHFKADPGGTLMHDVFTYEVPLGPLGWIFNVLLLERHMRQFLLDRNRHLKEYCERLNTENSVTM